MIDHLDYGVSPGRIEFTASIFFSFSLPFALFHSPRSTVARVFYGTCDGWGGNSFARLETLVLLQDNYFVPQEQQSIAGCRHSHMFSPQSYSMNRFALLSTRSVVWDAGNPQKHKQCRASLQCLSFDIYAAVLGVVPFHRVTTSGSRGGRTTKGKRNPMGNKPSPRPLTTRLC